MSSGGKRAGAGRPPKDNKRVQVSISVSQETKMMIEEMRKKGIKVGQVVDDQIRQYFDGIK